MRLLTKQNEISSRFSHFRRAWQHEEVCPKTFIQPSATNLEYVYNVTQKAVKYTSIKSKNLISIQLVRHWANPELISSHKYTEQHLFYLQMYLSVYNRGP